MDTDPRRFNYLVWCGSTDGRFTWLGADTAIEANAIAEKAERIYSGPILITRGDIMLQVALDARKEIANDHIR